MDTHINATMEDTRRKLLEEILTPEVHDRLKINMTQSKGDVIWTAFPGCCGHLVTKHELGKQAKFDDDYMTFMLKVAPENTAEIAPGAYFLARHGIDGHRYRLGPLPLAQATPHGHRRRAQAGCCRRSFLITPRGLRRLWPLSR